MFDVGGGSEMLRVEFLGISPEEGKMIIPRIQVKLRLVNQTGLEAYITRLEGTMLVNDHFAGRVVRVDPVILPPHKSINSNVFWELPYDILERVEKLRNGKRLRMKINVTFTAIVYGPSDDVNKLEDYVHQVGAIASWISLSDQRTSKVVLLNLKCSVLNPKTGNYEIDVAIDEWLEVLSKLGFKRVRVIEVPEIDVNGDPDLNAVIEDLDKAWKLMSQNFEESLNACRKALEDLKSYIKKKGFTKHFEDSEGKKKEKIDFKKLYGGEKFGEAMDKIFTGLWTLSDIGSHTGRSKLTKRADMEFVITSIYMLLKSVMENLKMSS